MHVRSIRKELTCDNNSPFQLVYLQHVALCADIFQSMILGPTPWKNQIIYVTETVFYKHFISKTFPVMENCERTPPQNKILQE